MLQASVCSCSLLGLCKQQHLPSAGFLQLLLVYHVLRWSQERSKTFYVRQFLAIVTFGHLLDSCIPSQSLVVYILRSQ